MRSLEEHLIDSRIVVNDTIRITLVVIIWLY